MNYCPSQDWDRYCDLMKEQEMFDELDAFLEENPHGQRLAKCAEELWKALPYINGVTEAHLTGRAVSALASILKTLVLECQADANRRQDAFEAALDEHGAYVEEQRRAVNYDEKDFFIGGDQP